MMIRLALLAALLLGAWPIPAGAQQLGRLFHSAAERSALDSLRKTKPPQQKPVSPQAPTAPQSARVEGYVMRPDGKSTLWVNGSAVSSAR
jgi:hypothetical protein